MINTIRKKWTKGVHCIFLLTLVFMCISANAYGQSTQFTYQGNLDSNGIPANGNHDFDFLLFDTLAGGTQIGTTVSLSNIAVANGVFSVSLDFGDQFPGAARFLEIRVRPSGQGGMTILAPRQVLASTPHAIRSVNAANADNATNAANATNADQLGGVASTEYVLTTDPRMTDARDPLPGSGTYIQNGTTVQPQANFNIGGDGTVGGVVSAAVVNAGTQFNLGSGRIIGVDEMTGNLYIGLDAGSSNPIGFNNSFVGRGAGRDNNSGSDGSFFGSFAGASNTTGCCNSFFGRVAGADNLTGSGNSFYGYFAGRENEIGEHNSFFGANAGKGTVTGSRNAFFGYDAGLTNLNVSDNSFFGYKAGREATNGSRNSFFGARAGAFSTNGSDNSYFGFEAGFSNGSGTDNAFFGNEAGRSNTTGGFNSFFGRNAGRSNSVGGVNVFVGSEAGTSNTSGGANAFVGSDAGGNNTTGASNSFLGRDAGDTNVSGSNNSALGRGSDVGSGALAFATAIGSDAVVNTSNTVQIGRNGLDIVRIGTLGPGGATSLCINGGNDIASCSSSIRYKSNVEDFRSGLNLVKRLRPVSFQWNRGGMPDVGLVAEEVAEVEPLLTTTKDGQIEGVKYDRVGVVLVNAVVELEAELQKEKEKTKSLTERVESLETILCELKPDAKACRPNEN